jgi:tetraacyldisaccharide 4'-kinase
MALVELLRARGWAADVLTRGYGREATGPNSAQQVVPDLEDAAMRFGDEPTLISRRMGVPVWVGKDRYLAGRTAEDFASEEKWDFVSETVVEVTPALPLRGVHLLDDGFQHRQLARAMDVVVVTAEDLEDRLLPAGNLREPLSALRRADAVVVREEELALVQRRVLGLVRAGVPVWAVRRRLEVEASGRPVVAFCAIARPEGFWAGLRAAGVEVVDAAAFPDHHRYTESDMRGLAKRLRACGAEAFCTTGKDAVKLTAELRAGLEAAGPIVIARLETEFLDADAVARAVEARCS